MGPYRSHTSIRKYIFLSSLGLLLLNPPRSLAISPNKAGQGCGWAITYSLQGSTTEQYTELDENMRPATFTSETVWSAADKIVHHDNPLSPRERGRGEGLEALRPEGEGLG